MKAEEQLRIHNMKNVSKNYSKSSIIDDDSSIKNRDQDNNSVRTFSLTKMYGKFSAISSLDINVNSGDIFGFLGPNGAGKTTTIRMLCGLILPSSGGGKVAGLDVLKDIKEIRTIIGLLPESSGYYNWMNAQEYLLYFAALYKIETDIAKKRARDLLDKVGLASKSLVPVGFYSRGMKQRLGLARTLINEPKVIFLDEPTLGLDPRGQQQIQKILLDLNRENNVTIFLSSHALSEVSSLCNRIAIVNKGRLVAQGTIEELRRLVARFSPLERGLLVRILNSDNARTLIQNLPLPIRINCKSISNSNGIIDIFISEDKEYESANKVIDIFNIAGLQIYEVRRIDMNLETIYFKLTDTKTGYSLQQRENDDAGNCSKQVIDNTTYTELNSNMENKI